VVRIWSELRVARTREQAADVLTLLWIGLWGLVAWKLFEFLAGFSEAGRTIRAGGRTMTESGVNLGASLAGVPFIGPQLDAVARDAFAGAGRPLSDFGAELEQFILIVAVVLALLLALVALVPWLSRYVPWRWQRLRRTRAGHRAIRGAANATEGEVQQILALRAIARLDYATLLDFTPDPMGDWAMGRHDRLARAELASVGLRPQPIAI
jgi:hypothetical protein